VLARIGVLAIAYPRVKVAASQGPRFPFPLDLARRIEIASRCDCVLSLASLATFPQRFHTARAFKMLLD
jgi:hypothetical protein